MIDKFEFRIANDSIWSIRTFLFLVLAIIILSIIYSFLNLSWWFWLCSFAYLGILFCLDRRVYGLDIALEDSKLYVHKRSVFPKRNKTDCYDLKELQLTVERFKQGMEFPLIL